MQDGARLLCAGAHVARSGSSGSTTCFSVLMDLASPDRPFIDLLDFQNPMSFCGANKQPLARGQCEVRHNASTAIVPK